MNPAEKNEFIRVIKDKDAAKCCLMCGYQDIEITGQVSLLFGENRDRIIPVGVIACCNCGFITMYALATLDLMYMVKR